MRRLALLITLLIAHTANANPPVASYVYPAGAQRGAKVNVKVGGLFLHEKCGFEMHGPGVTAPAFLTRTKTVWFEGPLLPIPDSQRQEDYPKDMLGQIAIAADAPLELRSWRLWTSQGATASMKFIIGDLPEMLEDEIDGDPIAVRVKTPVTINGRIFPREDVDIYSIQAKKGGAFRCEVNAARLGSPLDARLEVRDANGKRIAESESSNGDPVLTFTAPADGEYFVRIDDVRGQGGQAFVYRLTIQTAPLVERIFPLGGQRGMSVDFEITKHGAQAKMTFAIPKDATTSYSARELQAGHIALDIDDLAEFVHAAKHVTFPAVLNGRVEKPGQVDEWKWLGKKGESWEFELRAARLGSRLDGIVTITDGQGKPLTRAESTAADCVERVTVPADGEYIVKVQDRFASRGGPEFAYRLRVVPPAPPDFRLTLASDAVTLPRKGQAKLKVNIDRLSGFKEPIQLDVKGLPSHVSVPAVVVQPNQASVDLNFKADEQAKIDIARLTVVGKSKDAERTASFQANPANVLLAVAMPTPFVIKGEYDMGFAPRGAVHKRKYKIERNGYEGPIAVSLADRQARHLQGVEATSITVPAGVSEFTYSAFLPPWMETGRTCRVCVQGVGVIKEPDGSEHRVCFSSVNQNEQLVAVVGPGMLALEAERTSFRAEPGKQFSIGFKVQRGQGIEGPVTLELITPQHQRGLSSTKATLDAKQDRGQVNVTCADKLMGPFNMPVILRATLMRGGEPIVAEVKLDVQP